MIHKIGKIIEKEGSLIFLNDRFECPPRAVKVSRYAEVCQCVFGILEFEAINAIFTYFS